MQRTLAIPSPLLCAIALAVLGPMLSPYVSDLVVKVMILSIFALSLELLVGMTGLVSLGHAAFFGIGAYATVLGSGKDGGSIALLLPLAMGSAAAYALVGRRAEPAHPRRLLHHGHAGLRADGLLRLPRHAAGRRQRRHLHVHPPGPRRARPGEPLRAVLLSCWPRWCCTYGLLALMRRSRFGAALAGIRVNEQRMRAAGFATYGYKLAAFVIAGALAGLAGFLLASRDGVVNPELLAWHNSGEVLLMIILGGLGHLRGAVIGAVAFTLLKELLSTHALVGPLAEHWQLTLGLAIIAFVALLPKGSSASRRASSPAAAKPSEGSCRMSHPAGGRTLTRRFGGLVAVNAVTLDLRRGEVHAVIGTNGAGKSTLINMLSGEIERLRRPHRARRRGHHARAQSRRARAGVGRSYQRTTIFPEFTVLENCRLAAQAATPRPWAIWQSASHCADEQRRRRARRWPRPASTAWPSASPAR